MQEQVTIDKTLDQPPGQNYSLLYEEGISWIQQLGSDLWTDYNLHDPGVTILEMLAYALTELSYKAGFSVQDLLTTSDGKTQLYSCGLYSARQVMTNNAITLGDQRRYIIDSSAFIANAWVSADQDKGLLNVYLLVSNSNVDQAVLLKETNNLLLNYNNVGEQPGKVMILKSVLLQLTLDISLDRSVKADETVAQFLYNISDFLSPTVHFSTLQEMQNSGMPAVEIFEGPALKHGFIPDSELKDKVSTITASDVIRIIKSTPGVISINKISMKVNDPSGVQQEINAGFVMKDEYIADVDLNYALDNMTISVDGNQLAVNEVNISNFYRQMESAENRSFRLNPATSSNDFPNPAGTYLHPGSYYSLQENFPVIYGTSSSGLPPNSTDQRQAQAHQLKAYLLFFEQILANYLGQMENISQVYSISTQQSMYHMNTLYQVPNVSDLLAAYTEYYQKAKSPNRSDQELWTAFTNDPDNEYVTGTTKAMRQSEEFPDRRDDLLNFLLSIYNQRLPVYSPGLQFDWMSQGEEPVIAIKQNYLAQYPLLGAQRALAGDILHMGGAERNLRVLLDIPKRPTSPIFEIIQAVISIQPSDTSSDASSPYPEAQQEGGTFSGGIKDLYQFFRQACTDRQYTAIRTDSGQVSVALNMGNAQITVAGSGSGAGPYNELRSFQAKVMELSTKAENFYVIDHSDFRPPEGLEPTLPANFFNYSMSYIFPGFTLRFGDPAYRKYVESLVLDYTPAHVRPFVYWLNLEEMRDFELCYYGLKGTGFGTSDSAATGQEEEAMRLFLYKLYLEQTIIS